MSQLFLWHVRLRHLAVTFCDTPTSLLFLLQLAFFDRNKESLMAIFVRYAMGDTPSGTASWSSINDSLSTMSEREFTKVCEGHPVSSHMQMHADAHAATRSSSHARASTHKYTRTRTRNLTHTTHT